MKCGRGACRTTESQGAIDGEGLVRVLLARSRGRGLRLGGLAVPFRLRPMGVRPVPVRRFDDLAIANRPIPETVAKVRCRSTEFNCPVDPSEAHPRITARSERAHLHHPIGDAPGRVPRSALAFQPDTGLGRAAVCRAHPGAGYFRMEITA
jgi:hypothetical protein